MRGRSEAPEGPIAGTGPRVLSVAEAAAILRVSQGAVFDWIAQRCLAAGCLPDGALGVQVSGQEHVAGGARGTDVTLFITSSGAAGDDSALVFSEELVRERRELELAGLYVGEVDIDALSAVLAERLSRVVPAGFTASAASGLVWIRDADGAGAGTTSRGQSATMRSLSRLGYAGQRSRRSRPRRTRLRRQRLGRGLLAPASFLAVLWVPAQRSTAV